MDKFDVHAWKFQQLVKEMQEDNDVNDLVYDIRNMIQEFARSHSEDENMQLLKRLKELVDYYGGSTMEESKELNEEDDRCTRIAKRKYDVWPSAYASGAVVRCRKGEIWKNEK
jgi:uncharacterized protein (UPF0303 family)